MQNSEHHEHRAGKKVLENPDEQIAAALRDGLSEDRSRIDSNPIHRELASSSKPRYAVMIEV
jgi:hypothetical protein